MSRSSSRKMSEHETTAEEVTNGPSSELPLEDQVRELREERENLRAMHDMVSSDAGSGLVSKWVVTYMYMYAVMPAVG